jgi:hypothetical protein
MATMAIPEAKILKEASRPRHRAAFLASPIFGNQVVVEGAEPLIPSLKLQSFGCPPAGNVFGRRNGSVARQGSMYG